MVYIYLGNGLYLNSVDISVNDEGGTGYSKFKLFRNAQIHIPSGQTINIDDETALSFFQQVFDKLDPKTLSVLADKIYKSKFQDIVNK